MNWIREGTIFLRAIAWMLCATIVALPMHGYARDYADAKAVANNAPEIGRGAQQFGRGMFEAFKDNQGSVNGNTISIPTLKDGQFQSGGPQLQINDLYPGTSSSNQKPPGYFFPDQYGRDSSQWEKKYDSDSGMNSMGAKAKQQLWADAMRNDPKSLQGSAYKILMQSASMPKDKFDNDPAFNNSRDVFADTDLMESFGDCSVTTSFDKTTRDAHVPEYEMCGRVAKPQGDCEIRHNIRIGSQASMVKIASKGRTWITVRFDLKDGSWQPISPSDGEQKKAVIPTVDYDSICKDGGKKHVTDFVAAWDWNSGIPGKIDSTVHYRVKEYPTCDNKLVGVVQIEDTTVSSDTKYVLAGKFMFRFVTLYEDSWEPSKCVEAAQTIDDKGFCDGSIEVLEGPESETACSVISGVEICPGDPVYNALKPSPITGISRVAETVKLSSMQCDFNAGPMDCWVDPQGDEHCPVNPGDNLDTCGDLEANPQCGFIKSECADGGRGDDSGLCYVYTDIYDCGYDAKVPTINKTDKYQCGGPIKCMGDECLDISKSESTDFARATALLNAAQFMAQDMECSDGATSEGGDENVDVGCMVFSGEPGECKVAVGGVQDCCKKPSGVSLQDYLTVLMAVPKMDSAVMALDEGNALRSTYELLRTPAVKTWGQITKPFTSYIDNISGAWDSITTPVTEIKEQIIGKLEEAINKLMEKLLGKSLEDLGIGGAVGGGSGTAGADATGTAVGSILGTVMLIYTIYVVAMILIKVIWKCEEDEFMMNAQRKLKNCAYVGSYCKSKVLGLCIEKRQSYCCFNSPLSRIINKQIRQQLYSHDKPFGSAKSPQCGGVPIEDIAKVDWSKIDLDEWLGILQKNGKFPDVNNMDLDSLTGSGNDFNYADSRLNAADRTQKRFEGGNVDSTRRSVGNHMDLDVGGP